MLKVYQCVDAVGGGLSVPVEEEVIAVTIQLTFIHS